MQTLKVGCFILMDGLSSSLPVASNLHCHGYPDCGDGKVVGHGVISLDAERMIVYSALMCGLQL